MSMTAALRRTLLLGCAAGIAGQACAADEQGAIEQSHQDHVASRPMIEEIHVSGQRRGSSTAPDLEEMRKRMRRIPGSVDLIGSEAFDQRHAENIADLLRLTPGVFAQERYAEEIRLSIRGSGLSNNFHNRGVELLLDGVPINFADGFGDFQEVDGRLIRHIEVYKGGNGIEYGAATLGGAINFVSPTGRTAKADVDLAADAGSFATGRFTAAFAGAGETLDWFVSGTGVHSDQFRDHSTQLTGRLNMNLGIRLGDHAETRFYLIANHINQEIPGSLTFEDALVNRRDAAPVNIADDWARNIRSLRLINKTAIDFGEQGQLEFGAWGTLRDLDHPIFIFIDDETTDFGLFGRYSATRELLGLRHDISAGFLARRSATDDDWFVNVGGERGFQIRETDQTADQVQGYLRDQIWLRDDLALDIAVQAFATGRKFRDVFEPVNDDNVNFQAINPKVGLLWDADERIQVWTNVTRAVEPPSFGELVQRPILQFVPLGKQKSWTAELGTRGALGPLAFDIALFRAWIEGELLQFTVDPDVPANTFNADDTIHQGLEAGLDVTIGRDLLAPGDRLLLASSYTFSDFFFDDDRQFGDNTLPTVPRHVYQGELRYEQAERFHVAMSLAWTPKAPLVDFANTLRATDLAILGLDASVTLAEGWSVFVDISNLTDKRTITTFSNVVDASAPGVDLRIFTPGDGIGVFSGIRARF